MRIEFKNIHKYFGKVHANDGIDLVIPSGVIQGIVGENGAGKSTLMKVLSGFIHSDEGAIVLDEVNVHIKSPEDAIRLGIGMLHQDPMDFPPMSVIDNLLVSFQGGLLPDRKLTKNKFIEIASKFDINIDPEDHIETLSVGERQQVEILRLLLSGAKVLILDEPTTGISDLQKEKLFATLRKLSAEGITVIFVSHKLEEIQVLCDRVAVMRAGKLVGSATAPFSLDDLVKEMFGKEVTLGIRKDICGGDVVLTLNNLEIESNRLQIKNVNLKVCKGEVIGLVGMEGSGQRLFLQSCCGLKLPVGHSQVLINGKDMTRKSYHAYMNEGVAFVPADRMTEGLIPGLSLSEHFALAEEHTNFFIDKNHVESLTETQIDSFNIRGTPRTLVEELSGGNQQRALLALLRVNLNLLLVEHPARGLDIESTIWIWGKLKERCKQGTAIIFTSSDLEQILYYSDRVLVFFGGRVSEPLVARNTTVEQLGQLIGGMGF